MLRQMIQEVVWAENPDRGRPVHWLAGSSPTLFQMGRLVGQRSAQALSSSCSSAAVGATTSARVHRCPGHPVVTMRAR